MNHCHQVIELLSSSYSTLGPCISTKDLESCLMFLLSSFKLSFCQFYCLAHLVCLSLIFYIRNVGSSVVYGALLECIVTNTGTVFIYRVAQKIAPFLHTLTLPNINRFSKLFHYQNQEKICNNTITEDPTTPQLCLYTLPCEMSSVLKATSENKMISVITHFKKLTTGNSVFILSVIV